MTFDIRQHTPATLRMRATIAYSGHTAQDVFDIMGDPERITDWYLLAKAVKMHPPEDDGPPPFNVEFTFFGDVFERILHWDPPNRYVYLAEGKNFPIRDYVACITVEADTEQSGTMLWDVYCDEIEGEHYQRILPVILPAINEASMERLAQMIGGSSCSVESYF